MEQKRFKIFFYKEEEEEEGRVLFLRDQFDCLENCFVCVLTVLLQYSNNNNFCYCVFG